MPRPKKFDDEMTPLGFRLPNQLIARLDAFCERTGSLTGFAPSRSDAIRALLERALIAEEQRGSAAPKGKRKK